MVGSTGIAERIFNALAKNNINIILISQASSEHSICIAILPEATEQAEKALREELKYEIHYEIVTKIEIEKDMAIIAVVGENMRHRTGIAGRVFQTLGAHSINISAIAQGSSELNISMVISRRDEVNALNVLHQAFFFDDKEHINLFLTGTGLVGGALIGQIAALQNSGKQLRLCGLCNIDKMLVKEEGINGYKWNTVLDKNGQPSDIGKFIYEIKKTIVKNPVFVDCTSSEQVVNHYQELLDAGFSIVTPNKIANSREMSFYSSLMKKSSFNNPAYLYETTVGAGLPVIKTIRELLDTGDEILSIEGILSGTLSYLFNTYDGTVAFGEVVRKAKEMGYTEPDPRADLSGLDVVRKLLILVRETGTSLEMKDIVIQDFLPESLSKSGTVDEFLDSLVNQEEYFITIHNQAKEKHGVLRYIASWRNGKANVALETVSNDHPFYSLKGSENIIAFVTKRYDHMPLVVKGPGAGAEVTAAGVLSDILKAGKID
jgi:aspartokinase/homoserine dehydrogenase 1